MKKSPRILKIAFLSLLLSGCMTFEATIDDPEPLDLPAGTDPIPASVGVYYSPAFLTYTLDESLMGQHTMHFEMGEPSADHFDEVFLALFEDVQILSNLPADLYKYANLDGVIEPSFEQMTVEDPILNMPGEKYAVTLAFNFRLLEPDGEPHASWNITGRVRASCTGVVLTPHRRLLGMRQDSLLKMPANSFSRAFTPCPASISGSPRLTANDTVARFWPATA